MLPGPGLAGSARRVRIYLPADYQFGQPYPTPFWLDAQPDIDQLHWLPGLSEALSSQGEIPPVIVVAMDHGGQARPEEYLADGHRNLAARTWMWEMVLPYVAARYALVQCWVVGSSNGASMALQLVLAKPGIFSGGLFISPRHRNGLETILALAGDWPGGGRFFLSQGDFGLGEQEAIRGSKALAERLQERGALVHLATMQGYGHTFDAFYLMLSDGLRWLFTE